MEQSADEVQTGTQHLTSQVQNEKKYSMDTVQNWRPNLTEEVVSELFDGGIVWVDETFDQRGEGIRRVIVETLFVCADNWLKVLICMYLLSSVIESIWK